MKRVLISVMICLACAFIAAWIHADPGDKAAPAQDAVYHPTLNAWVSGGNVPEALPSKASLSTPSGNSSRGVTIIHSFGFPGGWLYARDAAWDGRALWIGENFNSAIYKIDPVTGPSSPFFTGPIPIPGAWPGTAPISTAPRSPCTICPPATPCPIGFTR